MNLSLMRGSWWRLIYIIGLAMGVGSCTEYAEVEDVNVTDCRFEDGTACGAVFLEGVDIAAEEPLPTAAIWMLSFSRPEEAVNELESAGFRPRTDVKPWPIKRPVNWAADPFDDRNWQFQLHAMRMVDPYLVAYREADDVEYLEEALEYYLDWHRYHLEEGQGSAFSWYDMSTGLRAMKLAYIVQEAERQEILNTSETLQALLELAWQHVEQLSDPEKLAKGNHGYFQLHGLRVLCSTIPRLSNCADTRQHIYDHLTEMLDRQFSSEGIFLEHSPQYHAFAMGIVRDLKRSGLYPELAILDKVSSGMRKNFPWFVLPGGRLLPFGDTSGSAKPKAVIKADTCLDTNDCYAHRVFGDSGYAFVRSADEEAVEEASYLALMASFHSHHHKQADDLSVYWMEKGRAVLTDGGKYSYNKDVYRDYMVSRRAHNTIWFTDESGEVLDGALIRQPYGAAEPQIELLDWGFKVSARVELTEIGVTHERKVLYVPGRWLAVVDTLVGSKTQELKKVSRGWLFDPSYERVSDEKMPALTNQEGSTVFIRFDEPGKCQSEWHVGEDGPPATGWVSERYNELTPAVQLERVCPMAEGRYVTAFGFSEAAVRQGMESGLRFVSGRQ